MVNSLSYHDSTALLAVFSTRRLVGYITFTSFRLRNFARIHVLPSSCLFRYVAVYSGQSFTRRMFCQPEISGDYD